jgi:subtilisin family serine protease
MYVVAALVSVGASALAPRSPLPPMPTQAPAAAGAPAVVAGEPQLMVKLRDGAGAAGASAAVGGGRFRAVVRPEQVAALVARAEERSGRAQPDYSALFVVDGVGASALGASSLALADRDDVEVVWVRPGPAALPGRRDGERKRREEGRERRSPERGEEPDTESYLELQRYLRASPGIDARWAWQQGFTGEGIRISDLEYALNRKHEELGRRVALSPGARPEDPFGGTSFDHGTAVMGIVVGRPDKSGIRGIAHAAESGFYPVWSASGGFTVEASLLAACADSAAGDVVMIELQTEIGGAYAPMEVDAAVWMATRTCADAGVVVVAAAGNGARDLDAPDLRFWSDRGDSGAILVGAGTGGADGELRAESFSNHGRRVDLQGWGSQVFTLGYGDHTVVGADPDRAYTASFAGTSSATPIVAGAAALVQQAAKQRLGEPLPPEDLRDLLKRTGVAQGSDRRSRPIGALPDVKAAIEGLPRPKRGGRAASGAGAVSVSVSAAAPPVPWWAWALSAAGGATALGAAGVAGVGVAGLGLGALVWRRRGSR